MFRHVLLIAAALAVQTGCDPLPTEPTEAPADQVERVGDFDRTDGEVLYGLMPHPNGPRVVPFVDVDGKAVYGGDVILGETAEVLRVADAVLEGSTLQATLSHLGGYEAVLWNEGVVPYQIANDFSPAMRTRILDAIDRWNTSDMPIVLVPELAGGETDLDFVTGSGCSASVGFSTVRTVTLGNNCSTGNIAHEIGHAIGMMHEQTRSDRSNHVTIHINDIEFDAETNFHVFPESDAVTPYDFGSIMHYGSFAFSVNGNPTIERKSGGLARRWGVTSSTWTEGPPGNQHLGHLRFGDFDGDGAQDLFRIENGEWQFSRMSTPAAQGWQTLTDAPDVALGDLIFGDFVGDDRTDILTITGQHWFVFDGGQTEQWWRTDPTATGALLAGDFDGDGRTDLLRRVVSRAGSQWQMLRGGTGRWVFRKTDSRPMTALQVLDIDGDGADDVYTRSGNSLIYASSASGDWRTLRTNAPPANAMRLGNFRGSSAIDILERTDTGWRVFTGITARVRTRTPLPPTFASPTTVAQTNDGAPDLHRVRFADFNGDGVLDTLAARIIVSQRAAFSAHDIAGVRAFYDRNVLRMFSPGTGQWSHLLIGSEIDAGDLHVGRFLPGSDQVFTTYRDRWWASDPDRQKWRYLKPSGVDADEILLGDFNGDGTSDVFAGWGGAWRIAYGRPHPSPAGDRTTGWIQVNTSNAEADDLLVGDFDCDGRDDLFLATGSKWYYSAAAESGWIWLNNSGLDELRIGDFDGDGCRDDVLGHYSGRWRVSFNGNTGWQPLAQSSIEIDEMRLGDFDGDGVTDVFTTFNDAMWFSSGGVGGWTQIAATGFDYDEMAIGDFDGDGRSDIAVNIDPIW